MLYASYELLCGLEAIEVMVIIALHVINVLCLDVQPEDIHLAIIIIYRSNRSVFTKRQTESKDSSLVVLDRPRQTQAS